MQGNEFLQAKTLVEVLRLRARLQAHRKACIYLANGEEEALSMTYGELDRSARTIAAHLRREGGEGRRALLLYPEGFDFLCALLGCFYAGVVAVAVYPPRNARHMPRLDAIIDDSRPAFALTNARAYKKLLEWLSRRDGERSLRLLRTDAFEDVSGEPEEETKVRPQDLALLQYTSGSTAAPKGVMVSHANILHNARCIGEVSKLSEASVGVTWLPAYHDMGLIDGILTPLVIGYPFYQMAPSAFVQRPVRWLKAISRYRATHSGGPNFAYETCLTISPEDMEDLDLSSWKFAFNGSEPIHERTLSAFVEKFAPCRLEPIQLCPCYGLAEATLAVTVNPVGVNPAFLEVDTAALERGEVVVAEESAKTRRLAGSGSTLRDMEVLIVDPRSRAPVEDGRIGEIWVSGPSVAQGYWQRPEQTRDDFQARPQGSDEGPFLRTGDLGFLHRGELFVTGRIKELIIVRGRNHYPQDIEATARVSHPALERGRGIAFGLPVEGEERLVVVHELSRHAARTADSADILESIRREVTRHHEIDAHDLVLVRDASLPKTSSGKLRRGACRQLYTEGGLKVVASLRDTRVAEPVAGETAPVDGPVSRERTYPAVRSWLTARLAQHLGTTAEKVSPLKSFNDYGVDSATAMRISGDLRQWLGRPLPVTLLYDYPTPDSLARHLGGAQSEALPGRPPARPEISESEPIAIVGIGCRFPGADGPDRYWDLLREGGDAIREVPASRWDRSQHFDPDPAARGKMNTVWGGFLDEVDRFDARFFGIAPVEAERMDPQQRLLLEVSWHALEDAGIAPADLAGTRTGVFVGISTNDYRQRQFARLDTLDQYAGTGNALSIAANRLSYVLDLRGPSLAVDTACSSSLSAVHLACESLRGGRCDLALAAGVNLILNPDLSVAFTKARMLAPDGRCKTFDASADGYVRGEGCGVVVLERLGDARRDRDRVVAAIRGSAINQDGRTNGLTAPNGRSQQAVLRQALEDARLDAAAIGYVEAHGTGTRLGDPLELSSIQAVLAEGREAGRRCFIGSAKTNVGHLEAAAGVAGLIKTALCLKHGEIVPHLHLQSLNPHAELRGEHFAIPTRHTPWPSADGSRHAVVSSFGFGGTNVSVILESAPEEVSAPSLAEPARPEVEEAQILTLSARSDAALRVLAGRYRKLADDPALRLDALCRSAHLGRSHLSHRSALLFADRETLAGQLEALAEGREQAGLWRGTIADDRPPKVAFLFTGQGAQRSGMGQELYRTEAVFKHALDACQEILDPFLKTSLLEVLFDSDRAILAETANTQPALFAFEYALAKLWESWGVVPDLVLGHSLGEYVAACVAGVFSLPDALRLTARRGRLMQALPRDGVMRVVDAEPGRVEEAIRPFQDDVSIAAYNGPRNVVVSGRRDAVEALAASFESHGVKTRPLKVSHAFHSPCMDPIVEAFRHEVSQVELHLPKLDLVSNLTGEIEVERWTDPACWSDHLRQPVRFATGVNALLQAGCRVWLEIGPAPVLLGMARQGLSAAQGLDGTLVTVPSLRKRGGERRSLRASLAELYACGVTVNWRGFHGAASSRETPLPTYPFERRRFWLEAEDAAPAPRLATSPVSHPLLGHRIPTSVLEPGEALYESALRLRPAGEGSPAPGEVASSHRVGDLSLLPAPGLMEMALAAGHDALGSAGLLVEGLRFHNPLVLSDRPRVVQTALRGSDEGVRAFEVYSLADGAEDGEVWTLHGAGRLSSAAETTVGEPWQAVRGSLSEVRPGEHLERCRAMGIEGDLAEVEGLWRREGEAVGRIRVAAGSEPVAGWINAGFQILATVLPACPAEKSWLMVEVERLRWQAPTPRSRDPVKLHSHVKITGEADGSWIGEVRLWTDGGPLAHVEGLRLIQQDTAALDRSAERGAALYEVAWERQPRPVLPPASPTELSAAAAQLMDALFTAEPGHEAYPAGLREIEQSCPGAVIDALRRLGLSFEKGSRFSSDEVIALGVQPEHRPLLGRLLQILREDGILDLDEGVWEVLRDDVVAPSWDDRIEELPVHRPELELIGRCAPRLAEVLKGEVDPLELLFPRGRMESTAAVYQTSLLTRVMNGVIRGLVSARLAEMPPAHKLRILEIGAGTGGLTTDLLSCLPAERCEYLFTDVSSVFLMQARERYRQHAFVDFKLFDVERPPAEQAIPVGSFDVVLAANVLHATRDLKETLAQVRRTLAPGALLILLEGTLPNRWLDLTFGLTDGWWRFADPERRPEYPLISVQRWRALLEACAFEEPAALFPPQVGPQQAVIVARAGSRRDVDAAARPWLVFTDREEAARGLAEEAASRGIPWIEVRPGQSFEKVGEDRYRVDPASRASFERLFAELATAHDARPEKIVYTWGLDARAPGDMEASELADATRRSAGAFLLLVQSLPDTGEAPPELWILTRDTQAVAPGDEVAGLVQAPLWGLGRVLSLERPELAVTLLDLGAQTSDEAPRVFEELLQAPVEEQLALRGEGRFVARLRERAAVDEAPVRVREDGTYLVTGGLGSLGLEAAESLVESGARHLVLVGRRPPSTEALTVIERLQEAGIVIRPLAADLADAGDLGRVFEEMASTLPPLRGIVHAAGVGHHRPLADCDLDELAAVFAPKVAGSWALKERVQGEELDFFVCFSSMVSVWGARDQGLYAAANHFLDSFAAHCRQLGIPATAVNWGPVSGGGMVPEEHLAELSKMGIWASSREQVGALLRRLLGVGAAQVVAVDIDWARFGELFTARRDKLLFAGLRPVSRDSAAFSRDGAARQHPPSGLLQKLREAPDSSAGILSHFLQQQIARILGLADGERCDPYQGFFDMGMDSLGMIVLKEALERELGRSLPATLALEHPTVDSLTRHLLTEVVPESVTTAPAAGNDGGPDLDEPAGPELDGLIAQELSKLEDVLSHE